MSARTGTRHASPCLLVAGVLASLSLGGCSLLNLVGLGKDDPPPVAAPAPAPIPLSEQPWKLTLELAATAELNPDTRGRPSPIRIHVFLAEPATDLTRLPFDEVFGPGGGLSPSATLTLRPGASARVELDSVRTRTRLSVAAAFRDPSSSAWIDTRILQPADEVQVSATIGAQRVLIENPS